MSSGERKVVRNFGCQYDVKDAGNRPSLKRVSIANTKVIFQIDEDYSSSKLGKEE